MSKNGRINAANAPKKVRKPVNPQRDEKAARKLTKGKGGGKRRLARTEEDTLNAREEKLRRTGRANLIAELRGEEPASVATPEPAPGPEETGPDLFGFDFSDRADSTPPEE